MLFAHGSREPLWARPFQRLAKAVSDRSGCNVALAYLERMTPTLEDAVAALVAGGATKIRVVPVFLAAGGHVVADLPQRVARLRAQHCAALIEIDAPIGEQPRVIEAIADAICADQ